MTHEPQNGDSPQHRQHALDVQFPPSTQVLNRTADFDKLTNLLESQDWLPDQDASRKAFMMYSRFVSQLEKVIQPALKGGHLPWAPLPHQGPRVLPICHQVGAHLQGWAPDSGWMNVGLHYEGRFVEFGYIFDEKVGESRWVQTAPKSLFVPPTVIIQAVTSGLRTACERATRVNANAEAVLAECQRATNLLNELRR